MNAEWSELNKKMQVQLKRKETFQDGIATLLLLRERLLSQIAEFRVTVKPEGFQAMPFIHANGYHNKTIAYSLYHIFRIEDIVVNTLIRSSEQVFFKDHYDKRLNASIITTGNELVKQEIADFSAKLNLEELYCYIDAVNNETTKMLKSIHFSDLRRKITVQDKERLATLGVVSGNAAWLIEYWCSKDIRGLMQMPLSRHWIMHVEASMRIQNKIKN